MKLQIETLTPPPAPAMGPAEAAALLAYLRTATDAHSPGVSSGERVLLCAAVGWLRALSVEPGPFDGFTVGTWKGPSLFARSAVHGEAWNRQAPFTTPPRPTQQPTRPTPRLVGNVGPLGWCAWTPTSGASPFLEGPETGQAGRDAVAAALRSRGAKL